MEAMPFEEFQSYYLAIDILECQEMLHAFTVADFPNMKKQNREKLHRNLHKRAYPEQNKRVITTEDLKVLLNG